MFFHPRSDSLTAPRTNSSHMKGECQSNANSIWFSTHFMPQNISTPITPAQDSDRHFSQENTTRHKMHTHAHEHTSSVNTNNQINTLANTQTHTHTHTLVHTLTPTILINDIICGVFTSDSETFIPTKVLQRPRGNTSTHSLMEQHWAERYPPAASH